MSVRLLLLNAYLRRAVKPRLARTRDAETLRRGLRRAAALLPPPSRDARPAPEQAPRDARLVWRWPRRARTTDLDRRADPDRSMGPGRRADPQRRLDGRVILYLHGGAYLAGSPHTHRGVIAALADAADALVVALDYRLAPEHPFPAAFEDSVAAYSALSRWLDGGRRIALAGDSAGGGLAFAVARDRADAGDSPAAVAAFSPFVDLALTGDSLARNATRDVMLPTERFADAAQTYLAGADPRDPRASPLYGVWSRPPPPSLIQASEAEALCDDALRMAEALRAAGGEAALEMRADAPHAWQFFAPWVRESAAAVASAGRFLAARLPSPDASSGG